MAEHLTRDPSLARSEGGPHRWTALTHLAYSRVPQADSVTTARLLVDAGADVDAGYLWGGLTPPFTVLTGCFGEGEQGPGRQPRHPEGDALARLLLDHGAAANDGQTLDNRMFNADNSHLELLFAYGLGGGDIGVWRDRLGDNAESVEEMMAQQVVDAREGGRTALHEAVFLGDIDLVRALLDAGADPDLVDEKHGTTPLGWAEYVAHTDLAQVLRPVTRHT